MHLIKNRKGISDVVGIAVIAMLTIAAISLVWAYVSDLESTLSSQLSPVSDCLQLNTEITSACYNAQNQQIELIVKTSQNDEISSLTFVTNDGQTSNSYACGSSSRSECLAQCIPPARGEAKKLFLPSQTQPNAITYYANNCAQFSREINNIQLCS